MAEDNGITPGYDMPYKIALLVMVFLTIALYNVIELSVVIFTTFKRRHGLYFWSLVIATWGIVPYVVGFILKFYVIPDSLILLAISFVAVGWPCMVTGQSFVLYSRLHLIDRNQKRSRWVLTMIVVDALIAHIPTIVLMFGSNTAKASMFVEGYSIIEKIQITIFFIQETVISGIYVWKTSTWLRSESGIRGEKSRKVMRHLILVNIVIIILDITLLGVEYAGYYDIQTTYKSAVYSVKLKMEFSILNRLLELFQGNNSMGQTSSSHGHTHPNTLRGVELGNLTANRRNVSKHQSIQNGTVTAVSSNLGNHAHVKKNSLTEAFGYGFKDTDVIKTTEVRVERSLAVHSPEPSPGDVDNASLAESSETQMKKRSNSTSSSEVQIVPRGY